MLRFLPARTPQLHGRHNPLVALEGLPFLALTFAAIALIIRFANPLWALLPGALLVLQYLIFRDPSRPIPASPRGVVSPVDGEVLEVRRQSAGVLQGEAICILIRIDSFGTYTARCPVEGKIMDLRTVRKDREIDYRTNALWVRTDEGVDVVLQFLGYRFGLAPRSFVRFGERLGQGQRCAHLRLTRCAEVHIPADSKIIAEPGQRLSGGSDLLAKVTH